MARCAVPAPCRRGTGAPLSNRFVALGAEYSAAERGGDGAARHPYLCLIAPGRNGHEISELTDRFRASRDGLRWAFTVFGVALQSPRPYHRQDL
jgi:hypothetical protein